MQTLALDIGADTYRADQFQERLRQGCLSGSGEAMSEDDRRPQRLRVSLGEIDIAVVFGEHGSSVVAGAELGGTQAPYLCPHHRAIREVEAQDRQPRVVPSDLQIGVEKALSQVVATAILQVHHGEGDFADDVDPAHRIVEFDAVEDSDLAIDARNVAKVQIAVALAYEPALLPLAERSVTGLVLTFRP